MLAHFFDHDDFKLTALQTKYQPVKTRQVYRVLPTAITLKCMAAQCGQAHQFVDAVGILDDVDPLDVSPRHRLTKCLPRFAMLQITGSQLPGFKLYDHRASLCQQRVIIV